MQLSKNFKLSEFEASATGSRLGIVNKIPADYVPNVQALVDHVLQPLADATGWTTDISSGYRNPTLNKAVGGVPSSQHLVGKAADTKHRTKQRGQIPRVEVARKVLELGLPFDQMILYPTFVHISYNGGRNRRQVLYNSSYKGARV